MKNVNPRVSLVITPICQKGEGQGACKTKAKVQLIAIFRFGESQGPATIFDISHQLKLHNRQ